MGRATGTGKTSLGAMDAAKALAGMIGSGARGALASTLGFPGDIESLLAEFVLGEQSGAPTVLPTIEDMQRTLPNLPPSMRVPVYEELGSFAATTPGMLGRAALGAVRPAARGAARLLDDAMLTGQGPLGAALAAARPMNVVKERGGNWLGGSVEDSLRPLLRHEPIKQSLNLEPELEAAYPAAALQQSKRAAHLNNWIQGPLRKYVMRDMASPEDPIRKLAEQGVLHIAPDALPLAPIRESSLIARRQATGFPTQGIATSDLGRLWERNADALVYPRTAERAMVSDPNWHPDIQALHRERALQKDPWLANLDPSSQVFSPESGMTSRLGFDHLVDVLNSDIQAGLLRPEQLNKVSVSDAVRRAYDFNARQAAEMAKARLASMESMPVVKEYPEAGMKWVELKAPEVADDSLDAAAKALQEDYLAGNVSPERALQEAKKSVARRQLEKWLKEEGDAMGHCVGGYCDDVLSGRSRIFSLRDAKGLPHVTIETQKGTALWADTDASDALRDSLRNQAYEAPHIKEAEARLASRIAQGDSRAQDQLDEMVNAYITEAWEKLPQPETHSIIQIKGKQNKAPVEKYLPLVQDFVKNQGPWADVGDLRNTGLLDLMAPSARDAEYNRRLMDAVGGRYATQDAISEALEKLRQGEGFAEGGGVEDPIQKIIEEAGGQYAAGGLVKSARSAYDVVQRLLRDSPALQGRAEELVARAPTTFNVIDPVPLSRSLRSSPSALMTPQEFLQAARPLPMSNADYDVVSGLRNLLQHQDAGGYEDLYSALTLDRRLFRGFDAPPALELSNDYFLPAVAGHDGRHRMLAIQGLYGNVPILTDLKTPLAPRSYLKSEKFREAPEWWNEMQTQTVPAPKPFAEGGPVEIIKSCGGRYE